MIPIVSWLEVVPDGLPITTLERSTGADGNVSDFEQDVINRLVAHSTPETIFEIGTFDGRTTLNMAANSPFDALLYTLDLPAAQVDETGLKIEDSERLLVSKPRSGACFAGSPFAQKITQLFGDSGTFDFSPYFGKMDFIFVHGSHSYEDVLSDSLKALSIASRKSLILWHDYVPSDPTPWPGLTRALHELHSRDPRFKSMVHIAGTTIVLLPIPTLSLLDVKDDVVVDSTQAELLKAEVQIELAGRTDESIRIRGRAKNSGQATWLPSNAPKGPVRLGVRLLTENGDCISENFGRAHIVERPIKSGESFGFEGMIPAPPAGSHILEFDFVADGVTWFSRNGSKYARLAICSADAIELL